MPTEQEQQAEIEALREVVQSRTPWRLRPQLERLLQSAQTSLAIADSMSRWDVATFKQARMAACQYRRVAERLQQRLAELTRLSRAVTMNCEVRLHCQYRPNCNCAHCRLCHWLDAQEAHDKDLACLLPEGIPSEGGPR